MLTLHSLGTYDTIGLFCFGGKTKPLARTLPPTPSSTSASASSGKILATQWFSTTAAASNPSQQPASQAEDLWYRTRDVAGRSASAVKDSLNRASSWIRTKVSPSSAPAPSPYYVPPRSPRP